jgi:DNA polymerase (family 10)
LTPAVRFGGDGHTGHESQLERIRGALEPEKQFPTTPGIGKELAIRLHVHLHIETLEAFEQTGQDWTP